MKSKAHYKKCVELGLNPLPTSVDDNYDMDDDQASSSGERISNMADGEDDSDTDDITDGDDGESTGNTFMKLPRRRCALN